MKIAHVVVSLDPAAGGPPIVAARLAAAQARLGSAGSGGHEVRLISYRQPHAETRIEKMLAEVPGASLLKRDEIGEYSRTERFFARGARRALAERATAIDVFHLHGVWDPILKAAAGAARAAGVPYVVAPHGMLDPWSLSQRRLKKRVALALGYRSMLNDAAFLHLLNRDEADLIRPLGLQSNGVVIPNGIDPDQLQDLPPLGAFRAAHPELRDDPYVLFLSRLHYKKGLDFLADAFAQVVRQQPDARLVVAGPDDGARADFEQRVQRAGLNGRVHVVGPLYGPDKYAAFRDASCFCLPSRQEGFSVAILEAMACGTPVVISDACHFPEVATAGAGAIVPLSADAVAAALEPILADPSRREQMGARGREMVLRDYTWPRVAEQMIGAYERVRAC